MDNRLKRYLKSRYSTLPDNWTEYRNDSGSDKSSLCVFCDANLLDSPAYPVFLAVTIAPNQTIDKETKCSCCRDCNRLIVTHKVQTTGAEDMFTNKILTVRDRLRDLSEGRFDETVSGHYAHDLEADFSTYCYVCKTATGGSQGEEWFEIQVPVNRTTISFTGGVVRICKKCGAQGYSDYGVGIGALNSKATLDKCVECLKSYPISPTEKEYRTVGKTFGKHLCPSCAYKYRTEEEVGVIVNTRMHETNCECCADVVSLDLTIKQDWKRLRRFFCSNCTYFNAIPFVHRRVDYRTVIAFFQHGNYIIVRLIEGHDDGHSSVKAEKRMGGTTNIDIMNATIEVLNDYKEKTTLF